MTLVFAHRGSTDGHAENTVEAFLAARQLGVDGVELDVRHSADGALVVHHDALLPSGRPVSETVVAALPDHVPLLTEALAACQGLSVNVEIKNVPGDPGFEKDRGIAVAVAHALADVDADVDAPADVFVSSFDRRCLDAVRRTTPGRALGWLLGPMESPKAALADAEEAGYQALNPFVAGIDGELVERAHRVGLALHVWTVNAPEDIGAVVSLGVDAVITDRPDVALAIARDR